jgi:Phosphotransferase enzyme family
MFTRPGDIADSDVASALSQGWGLDVDDVEYAPVGFGSYHWRVGDHGRRWFVSVDDLEVRRRGAHETRADAGARLRAALTVARSLHEAGLAFVVAPERTRAGNVLHVAHDRYAVALYQQVDGDAHEWGPYPTRAARLEVVGLLGQVHRVLVASAAVAFADDFAIPSRDELARALASTGAPWRTGPYGEPARELLATHADALVRVLSIYDRLVANTASRAKPRVITHGEPHRANTIDTTNGVMLIDWDTALIAPPERDLWSLIDEDPSMANAYTARTGTEIDDDAITQYRLWWDLCEMSLYLADFRRAHGATEDTRVAWDGLRRHLDPDRWRSLI